MEKKEGNKHEEIHAKKADVSDSKESAKEALSEVDSLKIQLSEKDKKIENLTDSFKRLAAEFDNFKKRNDRERMDMARFAHADMISKILPVIDSFEMALKNINDKEKFIDGMKRIYAQFHSILEAQGLRPIKTEGENFDPHLHEVLMKEKSEEPEDTILEEFQKGYMFMDKVLRHSKVKTSGK